MEVLIETKVSGILIVMYKTCDKYIIVYGAKVTTQYNLGDALAYYNNSVVHATYNYLEGMD